jgi:hypothetical protein
VKRKKRYNGKVRKKDGSVIFFIAAVAIAGALAENFLFSGTARAYSLANGAAPAGGVGVTSGNFDFGNILTSLQNFLQGIGFNSVPIGTFPQPSGIPSMSSSGFWSTSVQGALQWFDAWLYGIAGFHIIGLLTAILSIFSWLLGIVKGAVDWLLGILH